MSSTAPPPHEPVSSPEGLPEDLVLVLFDPRSGTIAGEGTLYSSLAGAVLADLALAGLIEVDERPGLTGNAVRALGTEAPTDPLLRPTWEHLAEKPRGTQTVLAGQGPLLRGPVLDRLVERGHLRREDGHFLGLFPRTTLELGDTGRREELVESLRSVLLDGADPDPRTAALTALVSASGNLPSLHREIPWSGTVQQRGAALASGDWGASAADAAVQRTTLAIASTGAALALLGVATTTS